MLNCSFTISLSKQTNQQTKPQRHLLGVNGFKSALLVQVLSKLEGLEIGFAPLSHSLVLLFC